MTESAADRPRIWVVTEGRSGDDAQLVNLAQALGLSWAHARLRGGIAAVLWDRLVDALGIDAPPRRLQWPAADPPDLLLFTGGRALSAGRRLRRFTGGRTRLVNVGRPWGSLRELDLIITTPQYRLPERANVVHNLLPLNRPGRAALDEAARSWRERLAHLPSPRLAVLVGGSSGSYVMSARDGERLAEHAQARAEARGGSLLVATSRRTPPEAARALFAKLRVPYHGYRWDDPGSDDNPYLGYLALADRFLVTGESASMLADACNSGRPVEIFPLRQRWHSRLLTDRLPALRPYRALSGWLQRLVERGLWMPPRDLTALHHALAAAGLTDNETSGAEPPYEHDLERARDAVRELLSADEETTTDRAASTAAVGSGREFGYDLS